MIGGRQPGCWWCKQAKVPVRPRSSKRMRYRRAHVKTSSMHTSCLANQQEDGDGPVREGSRKGLTEGLRNFVKKNTIIVPLK